MKIPITQSVSKPKVRMMHTLAEQSGTVDLSTLTQPELMSLWLGEYQCTHRAENPLHAFGVYLKVSPKHIQNTTPYGQKQSHLSVDQLIELELRTGLDLFDRWVSALRSKYHHERRLR